MSGRNLLVLLSDGTKIKVQGVASWTEPPAFPPEEDRPVLQNVECEIDSTHAREIEHQLTEVLRARKPLVFGRDWKYMPACSQSVYIIAWDEDGNKLASFNPIQVDGVWFEDIAEEVEDD